MEFNHKVYVNFVSELPLKGDSPKVIIESHSNEIFRVDFIDVDKKELVNSVKTKANKTIFGGRQWYTNWLINVYDEKNNLIHIETFSLNGKKVFIKMDATALGDSISWIPYIEEFRKKHNCTVICSTFHNYIFENSYPEILFVEPNIKIKNVYAQYYIGANYHNCDDEYNTQPSLVRINLTSFKFIDRTLLYNISGFSEFGNWSDIQKPKHEQYFNYPGNSVIVNGKIYLFSK